MTYENKIESIKHSNNQEEIIGIAKNDSDWHVRQFTLRYIDDEDVLKDIFINEDVTKVCITAMEQIRDPDFLADTCLNNPFAHIRLATLNRLLDEAMLSESRQEFLLKQIALNDPEDFVSKIAIENLEDQKVLIDIAESGRDETLRRAAISKITNENILMGCALNDSSAFIRREAILNPNLRNFNALSDIIKKDCDDFNRSWACEKITDGDCLLSLIFDESFYHSLDILSQNSSLPSDDYFIDAYNNDSDEYHRQAAVYFIRDKRFLENIVLNETNGKIRIEAIKNRHFTDQKIINDLLFSETDSELVYNLILKVDEDSLIKYVKNNLNDSKNTLQAIWGIDDVQFLEELSKHDNPEIRLQAVKSISLKVNKDNFSHILKDVAMHDTNIENRVVALNSIDDAGDLLEFVGFDNPREVRMAALNNLKAPRLLDTFLSDIPQSLNVFNERLTDIALDENDGEIRHLAISKLADKDVLDRIISSGNDDSIVAEDRLNALYEDIKLLNRPVILEKLISCDDSDVSFIAQKTLNDLSQWRRRINQINEINDLDKLKEIARDDFNYYVRCEAEGRIEKILFDIRLDEINLPENQEKLKDIVNDTSFTLEIRKKALLKINDESFLKEHEKII